MVPGLSNRFNAADYANDGKHHILLAASGSVATIKLPNIAQALAKHKNISIRIVVTKSAEEFLQGQSEEQPEVKSLLAIHGVDSIFFDENEWTKQWVRGDRILHIELRRWAHVLLIAPLSANTMAKIVNGLSDNLLLSVVRAWDTTGMVDMRKKRVFVAPAMNTAMWKHPITTKQIRVLEEDWAAGNDGWLTVLRPMEKELACGDTGDGAMQDWQEIVRTLEGHLGLRAEGK